ncbi:MAG: hypothetical protein R3B96_22020 [Pirellulaceae bacterium]
MNFLETGKRPLFMESKARRAEKGIRFLAERPLAISSSARCEGAPRAS